MAGADGIALSDMIKPDSRGRTYFTFAVMAPQEANDSLIMGTDYGKAFGEMRGSWVVIMAMESGYPMQADPSTSEAQGFYTTGAIRDGRGAYFRYIGPNFFPNNNAWSY